jgi:Dyp-type peroxidase family
MSTPLELEQIQGLILNGYAKKPAARYGIFEVTSAPLARQWLARLIPDVQFGEFRRTPPEEPPFLRDTCANIAFTYAGFEALGLDPRGLAGFSLPFQEGLAEPNRARRLGDDGESDPERWAWGKRGQRVHGVLCLFGGRGHGSSRDDEVLHALMEKLLDEASNGVRALTILETTQPNPEFRKENFGFRDGIANPRLSSLAKRDLTDAIADGEILLGYENAYERYPLSPEVPRTRDPKSCLPVSSERPDRGDFGKNGSYLVFRQLRQDVPAFWKYVFEAKDGIPGIPSGVDGAVWLAARFVGRWPNGTPLTRFPHHPGPASHDEQNDFLYSQTGDAYGTRCPIGSHVRRTNPRDTALPVPHDVDLSGTPYDTKVRAARVDLANKHRVMRRGRSYGPVIDPDYDPEKLRAAEGGPERGLHFLCFGADLARQFEFVQANWSVNPTFAGLGSDPDPLRSASRKYPFPASDFTIQGCPVRRVHHLPRVVDVRGGAYFFMPSRAALEYLSSL